MDGSVGSPLANGGRAAEMVNGGMSHAGIDSIVYRLSRRDPGLLSSTFSCAISPKYNPRIRFERFHENSKFGMGPIGLTLMK